MSKQKEQVIGKFMEKVKEHFDSSQLEPFQYAVAYKRVSDNTVIGYHASTWCDMVTDKINGKRYSGENPYDQLATINVNLKHILEVKDEDKGLFDDLKRQIKKQFYKGLSHEDIYLEADYLEDGIAPQKFVFQKIN